MRVSCGVIFRRFGTSGELRTGSATTTWVLLSNWHLRKQAGQAVHVTKSEPLSLFVLITSSNRTFARLERGMKKGKLMEVWATHDEMRWGRFRQPPPLRI